MGSVDTLDGISLRDRRGDLVLWRLCLAELESAQEQRCYAPPAVIFRCSPHFGEPRDLLWQLQRLMQRLPQPILMFLRQLVSARGQVENVDGHLAFGVDQGDLDIAQLP